MSSPGATREFPLEEEYKKDTGIKPEDIRKLRKWLDTQPHLPGDFITDLDLVLAYHSCECSPEVSKQVIDLHYTLKTLFTNFFKDRVVDNKVMKTLDYLLPLPLEMRSREGYGLFYARLIDSDVKKFVFHEACRATLMSIDAFQFEQGTWPGFVIIIDLNGVLLSHLTRLDVQSMQQFLYYLQEAMFTRIKSINFLNAPSFMDKLMMLIRPFLNKTFLEMIHIHQVGSKTIEEFASIEALPKEAGGEFLSNIQARDHVKEKITACSEYFLAENKKRVVESLRPGKPKTITDIFGSVEGSFKKLDID